MRISMQNCVRSINRETIKCHIMAVVWLESRPSRLQQRLFTTSPATLDDHRKETTSAHGSLNVSGCPLEGNPLRCNPNLRARYGEKGLLATSHSFAVRGFVSGSPLLSSDPSPSSSSSSTFEALGDIDELNCALGLAREYCSQAQLKSTSQQIEEIQSRLLDIGSAVAIPLNNPFSNSSKKVPRVKFNAATIEVLESWKANMDEEVPHQTGFILPSGGFPAASLHVARSICRRAERKMRTVVDEQVVDESVLRYLNRLSNYLFTAARSVAQKLEKPETPWRINQRR